jgi:integrase
MQIIKDWLGHSSILTTSMFYAKADEMAKRGVVGKVSMNG